jgi:hypothetical protein
MHPDHLSLAEKLVSGAESLEEEMVSLPTGLARIILEAAKRAPKPKGRQPLLGRKLVWDAMIIRQARSRKAELEAGGMAPKTATYKAAEEAQLALLRRAGRKLAVETIKDRLERKPR